MADKKDEKKPDKVKSEVKGEKKDDPAPGAPTPAGGPMPPGAPTPAGGPIPPGAPTPAGGPIPPGAPTPAGGPGAPKPPGDPKVPLPTPTSNMSLEQLSKNVPGGGQRPKMIKAPGMEGQGIGLQLEEAEVLPYESVFEWDIVDPVGYYGEDEKYAELLKVFDGDEVKTAVLEGMWRDRIKYQVLRRFMWPPKLLKGQVFFTRGYYEDYESRPTVNIQWLHLQRDKKRQRQENKMRTAGEHRMDLQSSLDHSIHRKESLSEFDPAIYNRKLLVIRGLGRDTNPDMFKKMFPKGHVVMLDDGMGGLKAEVEFQELDDARAAFRLGNKTPINGHPMNILPKRHPRPSLSDFDPIVYNREILVIRGLGKDTTLEELQAMFPLAKINLKDNGTGGQTAEMEFKNEDDASDAYQKALESKIKGHTINILPIERKPHPKDSLSQFDPIIYNREILVIKGLPKNTDPKELAKIFPDGAVTIKDNGKGGVDVEVAYKNYDEARAGFKKAVNSKLQGKSMNLRPIMWEGEGGHAPPAKLDLSKFQKHDKHPPPPPVITGQKKSLSEFDPLVYNRQILNIKGLAKETPKDMLDKMFPTGIVSFKADASGALEVDIEFQSEDDARLAFRHALKSKIKGQPINILPIMRIPGSGLDDVDRGDVVYANPYMIKSKIQAHPLRSKDAPKGVKPKTTKKLNEYDPIDYDYLTLDVHGCGPGTKKDDLKKIFPRAAEIKSVDPDTRYPGKLNGVVVFKTREDAMYSYIDNHEQLINDGEMDIIPQRKDGKPEPPKKGGAGAKSVTAPRPKTTKKLTSYNPLEYDYLKLDVKMIPTGTTKDEVQKHFPKGNVQSVEADPDHPGRLVGVVNFQNRDDAIFAYAENHEQLINNGEMDIVPQKLKEDEGKKKKKDADKPKINKALTSYNPLEYDYLNLDVTNIEPGTTKDQIQKMFRNGKVLRLEPDPANPKLMVAVVNFEVREGAIEDYKNAIDKPLNGLEINIVPQKLGEKKKKEKKKKEEEPPQTEVIEEVSYEVVKKPKKEKKEKKSKAEVTESEPSTQVIEEVTYEVVKKPKKDKDKKEKKDKSEK